jgi:hypothetical protein
MDVAELIWPLDAGNAGLQTISNGTTSGGAITILNFLLVNGDTSFLYAKRIMEKSIEH